MKTESRKRSILKVFISSTSEDLSDYRSAAEQVICDLKWHPVGMEHMGARPETTVAACRDDLEECDLMLLIVAFRRGWVPSKTQGGNGSDSITALELACAKERNIPVLALLADDEWPGRLWENEQEARDWVDTFRQELNRPAVFFAHEEVVQSDVEQLPLFRAKVREALLEQKERMLALREDEPVKTAVKFFAKARDGLLEASYIPFVGPESHGSGVLTSGSLARELARQSETEEKLELATAAEYHLRYKETRQAFLPSFRSLLERESRKAELSPVHDLVAALGNCPLVISNSFDMLMEDRLRKDRNVVIVAHLMHSKSGRHDGKIIVFKNGESPQFYPADVLDLELLGKGDIVVYKPIGSPFLNDDLDQADEMDTVVVTEADHVAFFRHLQNESTGIPKAIESRLMLRPVVFMGYALNVWQYRLMIQVFKSIRKIENRQSPLSVRVPESQIEEISWARLGVDLVRMDPNDFAIRALESASHH